MTAATQLAEFATGLSFDNLPAEVVERTKLNLLDMLGCGLAAARRGVADEGVGWAREAGAGGPSGLIGHAGGALAAQAALANGMLCHALDFDDTHPEAVLHTSTVTGPAALAVAQTRRRSGRELMVALVAGAETAARLGLAAPGAFHRRGLHPTAVCGVFGATLATSMLTSLSTERTTAALGLAGSTASGLFEHLTDGSMAKPFHAGWAAHAGVTVSALAARGAGGPATILEGRFGIYRTLLDLDAEEALAEQLATLGTRWETLAVSVKPYPACHFTHAAMDAGRDLLARGVAPDRIERLAIDVPAEAFSIVADPPDRRLRPETPHDGKFSIQYSTAAMLVRGAVDVDTYSMEALSDERILDLARRIDVSVADRGERGPFYSKVTARLAEGESVVADVAHPTGTAKRPVPPTEVVEKFFANAGAERGANAASRLADAVLALEELSSVDLLDLTATPDGD